MHHRSGSRQWVARSMPALLLLSALMVSADAADAQDDSRPIGIVDTGTSGPVTAIRLTGDGAAIVTAPAALRPDGPWTLTVVFADVDRRNARTVVAIDGDDLSAWGEQVSAATGERVALGERTVSAISPDELSIEVPGVDGDQRGAVWVVTESEAAEVVVTPMFDTRDLAVPRVPLRVGGVGWVTAGDAPSSWYWVSAGRGPTVSIADGILTIARHTNPIQQMDGQAVEAIVDHVILRSGNELPGEGPPLLDLRLDADDGSVEAVLSDGSKLDGVATAISGSDSLARNQEGIDIDLAALAAQAGINIDELTLVGLTREFTFADGPTIEMDGVDLPIAALGALGEGFGDRVAEGGAAVDERDTAVGDAATDSGSAREGADTNVYALTGAVAGVLGVLALVVWAGWRGLRSEALRKWHRTRRRHKERDRELRARRKADQSASP